jgi:hypothetical protein
VFPYSLTLADHVFPDRKRIIAGIRDVLRSHAAA